MNAMMTVEEALARVIASGAPPLAEEKVALEQAYGRVLVRDLKALRTQPPFPNSAMDGYALRAADTAPAPATLTVIGESAAGRAFEGAVGPGEAVRIFTGAPMPAGADSIVIQEDVEREGQRIRLSNAAPPGDNLRQAGMDFRKGESLVSAGRRLSPRDVALAAAANHTSARGPSPRTGRHSCNRRRTGRTRRVARTCANHRFQQFRRRRGCRGLWRSRGRSWYSRG